MTYTSALEWANNNIPKDEYDTFEDWYDKLTEKFNTPELTNSDVFRDLAKDEWVSEIGALDKADLEQPIEQEEIPEPSRTEEITIGVKVPKQAIEDTSKPRVIVLPPTGKAPTILNQAELERKVLTETLPQKKGAPIEIRKTIQDLTFITRPPALPRDTIPRFEGLRNKIITGLRDISSFFRRKK